MAGTLPSSALEEAALAALLGLSSSALTAATGPPPEAPAAPVFGGSRSACTQPDINQHQFRASFARDLLIFFIDIDDFLHIRSDLTSILLKTISAICLLSSSWLSPRRPVALSFTLTGLGKK